MDDQRGGRPRPRVQPKMNTDTKRHAEKSAYSRKAKYRDDPLDTIEPDIDEGEEPEPDAPADDEDEDDADDPGMPGGK